jgi:hypothetical protein
MGRGRGHLLEVGADGGIHGGRAGGDSGCRFLARRRGAAVAVSLREGRPQREQRRPPVKAAALRQPLRRRSPQPLAPPASFRPSPCSVPPLGAAVAGPPPPPPPRAGRCQRPPPPAPPPLRPPARPPGAAVAASRQATAGSCRAGPPSPPPCVSPAPPACVPPAVAPPAHRWPGGG